VGLIDEKKTEGRKSHATVSLNNSNILFVKVCGIWTQEEVPETLKPPPRVRSFSLIFINLICSTRGLIYLHVFRLFLSNICHNNLSNVVKQAQTKRAQPEFFVVEGTVPEDGGWDEVIE
jgi:hypothetical protein